MPKAYWIAHVTVDDPAAYEAYRQANAAAFAKVKADKEREAGDALRRQLKQYIDDAAQAKNEVSELKREIFKLQQQKK